jgi:hypothetical protein
MRKLILDLKKMLIEVMFHFQKNCNKKYFRENNNNNFIPFCVNT